MAEVAKQLSLSLRIEGGEVPPDFFTRTSDDLTHLLHSIEEGRPGAPHANWMIQANEITIAASVNGVSADDLHGIIGDAYDTFWAIETGNEKALPKSLDTEGRRTARRIVNRVRQTAPMEIEVTGREPIRIEPERVEAVQLLREVTHKESYSAWSSVDGNLDVISVRSRPQFAVYEHATRHRVVCTFPDDWLPRVKELLGFRVVVEGFVRYNHEGAPTSLTNPSSMEAIPEPTRSVEQLRGALPNISGRLSSFDYLRKIRAGKRRG